MFIFVRHGDALIGQLSFLEYGQETANVCECKHSHGECLMTDMIVDNRCQTVDPFHLTCILHLTLQSRKYLCQSPSILLFKMY